MKFEWQVAHRYLRSPHKPAVLRLVTLLSVVGVAAGVGTLVIALAMNTGFRQTIQDRLLGVTAHINLTRPTAQGIRDYRELATRLAQVPGVRAVSPAIYQTVLLSANGNARGIVLKGVDPDLERRSNEALRRVTSGTMDFAPDAEGIQAILLGRSLADEFHIDVGDYITLIGPEGHLTPFGMVAHPRRFHVTGIFESGFYDYDENWSFITLEAAQQMAGIGDLANVLEFRIEQLDRAPELAQTLVRGAGLGFAATTWMEQNRALFRALRLEKLVTAIFIGLITFVAGLNILVVLAMTVTDKARDVAVLMTMGARRAQIRRIFVLQGLTLGGVGTFSGLIIGYGLAWWAGAYHVIPLDPQVYAVPYVPFHANAFDALWIAAVSLAISFAATFLPARAAARVLPVEILRFE